jgi:hypothetical protein
MKAPWEMSGRFVCIIKIQVVLFNITLERYHDFLLLPAKKGRNSPASGFLAGRFGQAAFGVSFRQAFFISCFWSIIFWISSVRLGFCM